MKSNASSLDSLLASLFPAYGPSGRETGIRAILRRAVRGLGDVSEDATGSLHVHRPGRGPRLLVVAHMDSLGVIVTRLDGPGAARVALLGGRAPGDLVGSAVVFEDGTPALIGTDRSRSPKDGAELEADQLFLETGLEAKAAARGLRVGTVGALDGRPLRLGDLWGSANVDNRAGCAAVVSALREMRTVRYDLHVVFSAQSELGARGAATGAFGVDPDLAIVVDVAHAGDAKESGGIAVGKGPCLCLREQGYLAHQGTLDLAKRAAAAARVKTQWLIRESEGTDARAVRAARIGVPTALIAIPARRTGGAMSLVHARDIAQTAHVVGKLLSTAPRAAKGGSK